MATYVAIQNIPVKKQHYNCRLLNVLFEVLQRTLQSFMPVNFRLPAKDIPRLSDVRLTLFRIVLR
jgi:hypothetical protein